MKKTIAATFLFVFAAVFGFSQNAGIYVDLSPIERFCALMSHIDKQQSGKFGTKYGTVDQLRAAYQVNSKDTVRQQLIEALLDTRPYSHQYMDKVQCWKYRGKEAYRVAFNMIGDYCPQMTADMPRVWIKFWNQVKSRNLSMSDIAKAVSSFTIDYDFVLSYLPKSGVDTTLRMALYYAADGNRGAYQEDNIMVFDIISEPLTTNKFIQNTIAHEVHHIYYGAWLDQHINTTPVDSVFRKFQLTFMKEGLAQHVNYPTYSGAIKKLYANGALLKELQEDLETGNYTTDNYDTEMNRLKKYLPSASERDYGYRPTPHYYLSYNMYQSIAQVAGKETLQFVIENPKELISTYNKLYDEKVMRFGPFSDAFEKRWRNNL